MALIKCKECGNEVSNKAEKCPGCGVAMPKKFVILKAIGAVFAALFIIGLFAGNESGTASDPISSAINSAAQNEVDKIAVQVANDSVEQYNIAKRQGDKMQICVQAMSVSAAYLQAKDETNYNKWKNVEKNDCTAAGMPSQ